MLFAFSEPFVNQGIVLIFETEQYVLTIAIESVRQLPRLSDKRAKDPACLVFYDQDSGGIFTSVFEKCDKTASILVHPVQSLPIRGLQVQRQVPNQIRDHLIIQYTATSTYFLGHELQHLQLLLLCANFQQY